MRPPRNTASVICALALAGTFFAVWMSVTIDSDEASAADVHLVTTQPEPVLEALDAFTLVGAQSFLTGIDAVSKAGFINVVVEIPSGSVDKWEVAKNDGALRWEFRDGKPRQVQYLGYPGNYGMIPRTLLPAEQGGDGDPLDVIVLGPSVPRGSVIQARVVGVLALLDGGEQDDKLLAVQEGTALAEVESLEQLQERFPGVTEIVEIWFANYKGAGEIETLGLHGVAEAHAILDAAIQAFEAKHDGS